MQKNLLRQLKRSIGVDSEAALADLLVAAQADAGSAAPGVRALLAGFGDFLARVNSSYVQYERDLELRDVVWKYPRLNCQPVMNACANR